jgi:hypothetical protein
VLFLLEGMVLIARGVSLKINALKWLQVLFRLMLADLKCKTLQVKCAPWNDSLQWNQVLSIRLNGLKTVDRQWILIVVFFKGYLLSPIPIEYQLQNRIPIGILSQSNQYVDMGEVLDDLCQNGARTRT